MNKTIAVILLALCAGVSSLAIAADQYTVDTVDKLKNGTDLKKNFVKGDELLLSGKSCYKYTDSKLLLAALRDNVERKGCPDCIHAFRYAEQLTRETGRTMTTFPTCWTYDYIKGNMVFIQDQMGKLVVWTEDTDDLTLKPNLRFYDLPKQPRR